MYWAPAVFVFHFFYFFRRRRAFQIPDLASPDFYKADFFTFHPESGLAGQSASPDLDPVPDVLKFRPDFLYIPMYSRELTSLPGNGMI